MIRYRWIKYSGEDKSEICPVCDFCFSKYDYVKQEATTEEISIFEGLIIL